MGRHAEPRPRTKLWKPPSSGTVVASSGVAVVLIVGSIALAAPSLLWTAADAGAPTPPGPAALAASPDPSASPSVTPGDASTTAAPEPTTTTRKAKAAKKKTTPTTAKKTSQAAAATTTRAVPKTTTTTKAASSGGSASASEAKQVLALTNAEREANGCGALTWNAKLASAAQKHSADMAANDYFSHDSQDGTDPFTRIKAEGYSYRAAAENIAAGQPTPEAVVDAWMKSEGHRANILNCSLTELGVGVAKGGGYGIYWTQDFGTPA